MDTYHQRSDFEAEVINLRDTARAAGLYAAAVSLCGPLIALLSELIPTVSIALAACLWLTGCYASAVGLLCVGWLTLHLRLRLLVARRMHKGRWALTVITLALGTVATFTFIGSVIVVGFTEFIHSVDRSPYS